jgi:hypothetical protein
MNVLDIAPWLQLRRSLRKWTQQVSDTNGCVDLLDPIAARPPYALTDDKVPVLMLLDALFEGDWRPYACTLVHDNLTKNFDNRNAASKRCYYQVLLSLEWCLKTNPAISSNQPISYFRCILHDQKVLPNLGDQAYKALLDDADDDGAMLALPGPDNVPALEDHGFDAVDASAEVSARPRRPMLRIGNGDAPRRPPLLALPVPEESGSGFSESGSGSSSSSSRSDSASVQSFDAVGFGRSEVGDWHNIAGVQIKMDIPSPYDCGKNHTQKISEY